DLADGNGNKQPKKGEIGAQPPNFSMVDVGTELGFVEGGKLNQRIGRTSDQHCCHAKYQPIDPPLYQEFEANKERQSANQRNRHGKSRGCTDGGGSTRASCQSTAALPHGQKDARERQKPERPENRRVEK